MTPKEKIPENDLIKRLARKDAKAFEYLYDHYSAAIYGVVLRTVRQETIASEVLQDTFLKIWHKIDRYDPVRGRLFTWMVNIARHTAIDKLRSKEMSQSDKTGSLTSYVHEGKHLIKEDDIGVNDLLDLLTEDQKTVLELVYFGGYTHAEAARQLDIPLGTVKTRIRNGLLSLRKHLKTE